MSLPISRSRACLEGWAGRRRTYQCRICSIKFQHDGHQLPEKARICQRCQRENPELLKQVDEALRCR